MKKNKKRPFKDRLHPLKIEDTLRSRPGIYIDKGLLLQEGPKVAILYGELLSRYRYFADQDKLVAKNTFYNTVEDLQSAIGYADGSQRAAIRRLEELGLIKMESKLNKFGKWVRHFEILDVTDNLPGGDCVEEEQDVTFELETTFELEPTAVEVSQNENSPLKNYEEGAQKVSSNNNNYNNNNKERMNTTPAQPEKPKLVENLTEDFLKGTVGSSTKDKPAKGVFKKIEDGSLDKLTARDLYDYFAQKYRELYRRYPSSSKTPKTLGILRSSFLNKYGGAKCIEIIDSLFKYYDKIDLDRSRYPRPEISTLSQDWIINKILDYDKSHIEDVSPDIEEDVLGDYSPIEVEVQDPTLRLTQKMAILNLGRKGYLPPDWSELYCTDRSKAIQIIREAIDKWNERNKYQMRPFD